MGEFNLPYDIGVRALMHVGSPITGSPTVNTFPGSAKAQALIAACYGKLRRAELQRNIWARMTRRVALRPQGYTTMALAPTLWVSSVTYFQGSIVVDSNGTPWTSTIRNNLNNQPGQVLSAWAPYFGPLSAELYCSTTAYYTGEVVYTAAGDGTLNIYQSIMDGNPIHPALPNQWDTNTWYFKDNVLQVFPAWSSLTTYTPGQTALYTDGNYYSSLVSGNLNNPPATSPTDWALMPILQLQPGLPNPQVSFTQPFAGFALPSPLSTSPILEWNEQITYSQGNFVMFDASVWVSLVNSNTGNFPDASGSTSWAEVTGGTLWMSLIDLNLGNNPTDTPSAWSSAVTYTSGQVVAATDGYNYTATSSGGNLNKNPASGLNPTYWTQTALTAWTSTFVLGGGNQLWLQIGGAAFPNGVGLTRSGARYPMGSGPAQDQSTRNAYRLPGNYLRRAPQAPQAGRVSWLGFPGNIQQDDWLFEGQYLITMDCGPIIFRFVADVQNVPDFDDLFCEMLACKIAMQICEPLTQSTAKFSEIGADYKVARSDAITIGGIEVGSEEPPLEDLIATRI